MEKGEVRVGMLLELKDDCSRWRVICHVAKTFRMIDVSAKSLVFKDMEYVEITQSILKGSLRIVEDEDFYVFDIDALSEKSREEFNRRRKFLHVIDTVYGPSYELLKYKVKKPEYDEALKEYGISSSAAQRLVVKWLQSGFQEISIVNAKKFAKTNHKQYEYKSKTGKPSGISQGVIVDEKCREAFRYGMELFTKQRLITIRDCYVSLLSKYYSSEDNDRVILLPVNERPTECQFRNFITNNITEKQKKIIKTSLEEYRNNERLIFSTPTIEALRPCFILEADALEIDLELVSSIDQTRIVGRPILYMMVDIYSHCIVAFSVSFENNSMIGLTNLLINLFESKEEFLARHNIVGFDTSLWPSNFIPNEIRCDRGPDLKSKDFENICSELNINRTLEPGATGSMKGSIEQSFRLFHQTFRMELENKGYIQKRYDSNHKSTACLTIEEVIKLTTLFVAYHNGKYSKKFKLSKDMIDSGVNKVPISIWNYGVKKYGMQQPVPESKRLEIMYKLMVDDTASISRQGVTYKGLYYLPYGDENLKIRMQMAVANAKRKDKDNFPLNSLRIKKDPRLINTLYYKNDDGIVKALILNPAKSGSYRNLSWEEYLEYYRYEKNLDKKGELQTLQRMVDRQQGVKSITGSIKKVVDTPISKSIKDTRRKEKNLTNTMNSISGRFPNDTSLQIEDEEEIKEEELIEDKKAEAVHVDSPLLSDEVPAFFLNQFDEEK